MLEPLFCKTVNTSMCCRLTYAGKLEEHWENSFPPQSNKEKGLIISHFLTRLSPDLLVNLAKSFFEV